METERCDSGNKDGTLEKEVGQWSPRAPKMGPWKQGSVGTGTRRQEMWLQGIVTLGHRNESLSIEMACSGRDETGAQECVSGDKDMALEEIGYSSRAVGIGTSRKKR